jgi:hypothetical protein
MASCSKDNDDIINVELEGKWILTDAACFCGFEPATDFSVHQITFYGSILTVTNSGQPQFLVGDSGSYIVNGNLITLHNGAQFTYVVKNDVLELTFVDNPNVADDELFLVYEKS